MADYENDLARVDGHKASAEPVGGDGFIRLPPMDTLMIGLGWDEAHQTLLDHLRGILGEKTEKHDLDLDLSLLLLDEGGAPLDVDPKKTCVYYDNLTMFGAIKHHGNNTTGQGEGCDEYITVALDLLPDDVSKMIVLVNINLGKIRHQDFTMAGAAYVALYNFRTLEEVRSLNLSRSRNAGMTGLVAFELQRVKGLHWKYRVIEQNMPDIPQVTDFVAIYNDASERSAFAISMQQLSDYAERNT